MMQHIVDRILAFLLVLAGLAFLWLAHPTDGAQTVTFVLIVAGAIQLVNSQTLQMLEKLLPLATAPAQVQTPSGGSSPSSPGQASSSTTSTGGSDSPGNPSFTQGG